MEPRTLFDHRREQLLEQQAPLAARMRPRTLAEFVGQERILGPGRLLRRAIQADQLSSLIFYGPPGCGKTTLAEIIAHTTRAHFTALNAVLAGVADIRKAIAEARGRLEQQGRRTILFVDEVHRFNKAQQDALLPHVENGTVIFVGATTENPYFEVNKTIVSRSRIFQLRQLDAADIGRLLRRALEDPERGYGRRRVEATPEALEHLAEVANGDARAALNALELAVETTPPDGRGAVAIDLAVAEESIQRKAVLYDKQGDVHFDTISVFIKSLRGSDPDAALYWMARMVYAGEDPRFILRRMLIFAAEDVGLADPDALRVTEAAARAFDYVGMPEGRFHLAEACLYLATAPKSNTTMAFFDALAAVERERLAEVPDPLKDPNRDAGLGHGRGYQYPHAYREHWVAQQYLPENLQGRLFYQPTDMGHEATVRQRVFRWREAQLAALAERSGDLAAQLVPLGDGGAEPGEAPAADREAEWRLRTRSTIGEHLQAVRQRIMALAVIRRDHLVLDARAGAGLLTWEALRAAPEGGVWALAAGDDEARALAERAGHLSALEAPVVLTGTVETLPELIASEAAGPVRFDRVLARGALGDAPERAARLEVLAGLLAPQGRVVLAESVPRRGERLLAHLDWSGLEPALAGRAVAAEAAVYADADDPAVNWDTGDLADWCAAAGLRVVQREELVRRVSLPLTRRDLARWFAPGGKLAAHLGDDAEAVRAYLERRLAEWQRHPERLARQTVVALVVAEPASAARETARGGRQGKSRKGRA